MMTGPAAETTRLVLATAIAGAFVAACAAPIDGAKRSRIRDCPVGQVLICEDRTTRAPSRGGDEEIPEYDFCYCEDVL